MTKAYVLMETWPDGASRPVAVAKRQGIAEQEVLALINKSRQKQSGSGPITRYWYQAVEVLR